MDDRSPEPWQQPDVQRTTELHPGQHLTQFATEDGAQSYFLGRASSWTADPAVTGTFSVPNGGAGYEKSALDKLGNRRTIMFERVGDIVVALNVYTPGKLNRPSDLAAMAAQAARLR
jgi:hypothetical protein